MPYFFLTEKCMGSLIISYSQRSIGPLGPEFALRLLDGLFHDLHVGLGRQHHRLRLRRLHRSLHQSQYLRMVSVYLGRRGRRRGRLSLISLSTRRGFLTRVYSIRCNVVTISWKKRWDIEM